MRTIGLPMFHRYSLAAVLRDGEAGGGAGGGGQAGGQQGGGQQAGADGGQQGGQPFYSSWGLDENATKFIGDKGFTDPATLVKSAIESDRVARARNVIEMPNPQKLDEWKGWENLGWTPDAAKYNLEKPTLKDEKAFNQPMFDKFREIAHAARVPVGQAQKLYQGMTDFIMAQVEEMQSDETRAATTARTELETALRKEWPGALFEQKKALGQRAMAHLGIGAEDGTELERMIGSPRVFKLFAKLGEAIGEDNLVHTPGGGSGGGETLDAIGADKRKFQGDAAKMKALRDPSHPQHQDVQAEWARFAEREAKVQSRGR